MKKKEIGDKGETIAVNFLEKTGFNIIERNWRHKHLEIDIIATQNRKLHFIEVKTRTNTLFGLPEQSVGKVKMEHLKKAAVAYLRNNPEWLLIQFDVIAIMITKEGNEVFLIEDVFF
ncbi:YraN family protein [Parasediminibacterium sp. JCM 36343]|uniref:YraN family protein n=1 Tax=Parasediminibacterium sp. JCM 36343 TaxID=3374279 RepID=UPI00397D1D95